MNDQPSTDEPADDAKPFQIEVAERMKRLPGYLFARINQLTYQKRRAGDDVIDMSMGNPTGSTVGNGNRASAKQPEISHVAWLQPGAGHHESKARGGGQVFKEIRCAARSGKRNHCHARIKRRFQPHVPGAAGPGRYGHRPARPAYPAHMYAVALASAGAISLEVADNEKLLSNIAYTCQHLHPRPKVVILNYPHNPSTVTVDPEFYADAVKLARRYGLMIISDLAYADVTYDGYQVPSILATPGAKKLAVEFTTMSKGYNMAGWRVGFCAGNAEMIRALSTIKAYYDYGMFRPIQIAAIMALRNGDADVEAQSAEYQRRRDVLVEGLRRLGWEVNPPRASMFLWLKIPAPWYGKLNSLEFATKLLEEGSVAVSPGSGFGPAGEGYLRMALIENENRLRQAVRQIARCLGTPDKGQSAAAKQQGTAAQG